MSTEELEEVPVYRPPATNEQITIGLQRVLVTDPHAYASGMLVKVENARVDFIGAMTRTVREAARHIGGVIGLAEDTFEEAHETPRKP